MSYQIERKLSVHKMGQHEGSDTMWVAIKEVADITAPAKQGGNSLSSGLFDSNDFGQGTTYERVRYALVEKIPAGKTVEDINKLLANLPDACIYSICSNDIKDVLTKEQISAMESGVSNMTIEEYMDKYETQDSDGNRYSGGSLNNDGTLPREYTRRIFNSTFVEDKDLRIASKANVSQGTDLNKIFG